MIAVKCLYFTIKLVYFQSMRLLYENYSIYKLDKLKSKDFYKQTLKYEAYL